MRCSRSLVCRVSRRSSRFLLHQNRSHSPSAKSRMEQTTIAPMTPGRRPLPDVDEFSDDEEGNATEGVVSDDEGNTTEGVVSDDEEGNTTEDVGGR